jgi:tetratricopeptide (TPR) repeat protein
MSFINIKTDGFDLKKLNTDYGVDIAVLEVITQIDRLENTIQNIKTDDDLRIELIQFIYNIDYYQELDNKLKRYWIEIEKTDDDSVRIVMNKTINQLQTQIKQYKIDVLLTATILLQIDETPLIEEAKKYFFGGKVKQALEVLNETELSQTRHNLLSLIETNQQLNEVYKLLVDNAFEFLIKAQLTALNLKITDDDDRFLKAIDFFEKGLVSINKSRQIDSEATYKFAYADFLQERDKFQKADLLYEELYIRLGQTDDTDYYPGLARILHSLGISARRANDYDEAISLHQDALLIKESLVEYDPKVYLPTLKLTIDDLGVSSVHQKNYVLAEEYFNRGLAISHKIEGAKKGLHHYISFNNLASMHMFKGEYDLAEKFYTYCIGLKSDVVDTDAQALNNLANLYREKGAHDKALVRLEQVLIIRRNLFEKDPFLWRKKIVDTLMDLATTVQYLGELNRGAIYLEEALKITQELLKNAPDLYADKYARLLNNLGNLHWRNKNASKAMSYYLESLERYRSLLVKNRNYTLPNIITLLYNIAVVEFNSNNLSTAKEKCEEALELSSELSSVITLTVEITLLMGNLYYEQGLVEKAQQYYEQSIELFQQLVAERRIINIDSYLSVLKLLKEIYTSKGNGSGIKHLEQKITLLSEDLKST